ncbi:hypothetical protein MC28_D206 (plasmid) [Bacillus thuringiensis MC28]|nr:hypothetical protein MC28_D100 [Bacillus thuringiensis MC28]AFU17255.1 hypothetical protein MC28_D206 [Bacillus thuringiensis MC28]
MDIERKKKGNKKLGKGLIKISSIIILVVGCLVYIGISLDDYLDKIKKEHETKTEQTHENIKIAEEMIEKELNISSKYFKMISKRIVLYAPEYVHLNFNREGYWINENLKCRVQMKGESYNITFETKKVDTKNEELEIYEPVKINKIIKAHS